MNGFLYRYWNKFDKGETVHSKYTKVEMDNEKVRNQILYKSQKI